ncbi:MAG: DMT family protein [Bacteroidetes bacterium]|nr:DMT family protein [Bacteroidota bacterium]MCL1969540.1 DMT family protein [Bacteroidota bacterium]
MKAVYTIILLVIANIFMTLAWYGHLKLQEMKLINSWPLFGVILFSWGIALFEYCFQVPANRIGFEENGGPFSLMQLKVIQEVITLVVFTVFALLAFKNEQLHWNHIAAFVCLILAVYFVFMK